MYNKKIKLSKTLINGYEWFYDIEHPLAFSTGIVYYHRHVMSLYLGRWINSNEHIHHINGNRSDNNIKNLEITNSSDHVKMHKGTRKLRKCVYCKKETYNKKYCSQRCSSLSKRIAERPSKKELSKMIKEMSWCEIGRKYNVSDNSIRKWARKYKII